MNIKEFTAGCHDVFKFYLSELKHSKRDELISKFKLVGLLEIASLVKQFENDNPDDLEGKKLVHALYKYYELSIINHLNSDSID